MLGTDWIEQEREVLRAVRAATATRAQAEPQAEARLRQGREAAESALGQARETATAHVGDAFAALTRASSALDSARLGYLLDSAATADPAVDPGAEASERLAKAYAEALDAAAAVERSVAEVLAWRQGRARLRGRLTVLAVAALLAAAVVAWLGLQPCGWLDSAFDHRSGCLVMLTADTTNAQSLTFTRDGKTLLSGGWDGQLRSWDAASGRQLGTVNHRGGILSLASSPDGRMLAFGSNDQTARLWDTAASKEGPVLRGHTKQVNSVAFSPDGKMLASGSDDNTVKLWEVNTGRLLANIPHQSPVSSVAVAQDGRFLAFGSVNDTVILWDMVSLQPGPTLRGDGRNSVTRVIFVRDSQVVVTTSGDGTVRLWDIANGREIRRISVIPVSSTAMSLDGKTLAIGTNAGTVKFLDVASGQELGGLFVKGAAPVRSLAFSPDGTLLASVADGDVVRLWATNQRTK